MIIEGKNPVKEALNSTATIEKLYCISGTDPQIGYIISAAKQKKIKVVTAEKALLDKLSPTGRHQGVLAVATEFLYSTVNDILNTAKEKNEPHFIVILDGVEDPHNLGAIIRSCESAGVHGIIIGKHRATGVTDTVVKVSSGAVQHMRIAKVTNINDTIRELKDKFINIYAADMSGKLMYGADMRGDLAVIIGGEGSGVHALTLKLADKVISIPAKGKVNSLNASVACGVVVYEAVRQRG